MGNAWVFSSISHIMGKGNKTVRMGESLRNWFPYSFHSMGVFSIRFRLCRILHHMGNAWVFSSISHIKEKAVKPLEWGKPAKLVPILF